MGATQSARVDEEQRKLHTLYDSFPTAFSDCYDECCELTEDAEMRDVYTTYEQRLKEALKYWATITSKEDGDLECKLRAIGNRITQKSMDGWHGCTEQLRIVGANLIVSGRICRATHHLEIACMLPRTYLPMQFGSAIMLTLIAGMGSAENVVQHLISPSASTSAAFSQKALRNILSQAQALPDTDLHTSKITWTNNERSVVAIAWALLGEEFQAKKMATMTFVDSVRNAMDTGQLLQYYSPPDSWCCEFANGVVCAAFGEHELAVFYMLRHLDNSARARTKCAMFHKIAKAYATRARIPLDRKVRLLDKYGRMTDYCL